MKYLQIFNKGDKVKVNDKYPDLKSMKGEVYTIQAGPVKICGTWCYYLERVAGGIAADALEPEKQTNEEWFDSLTITEKSEFMAKAFESLLDDIENGKDVSFVKTVAFWDYWLNKEHKEL